MCRAVLSEAHDLVELAVEEVFWDAEYEQDMALMDIEYGIEVNDDGGQPDAAGAPARKGEPPDEG